MRCKHNGVFGWMDRDVIHRYLRNIVFKPRPFLSAINGYVKPEFCSRIQQVWIDAVFANDENVTFNLWRGDGCKSLAKIGSLINVWLHVTIAVIVERYIRGVSIKMSSLDRRTPVSGRQTNHC